MSTSKGKEVRKRQIETIVLSDSSDDEQSKPPQKVKKLSPRPPPARPAAPPREISSASSQTYDRAQLEAERRARQQQREADGVPSAPAPILRPAVSRPKVATLSDVISSESAPSASAVAASSSTAVHGFSSSSSGSNVHGMASVSSASSSSLYQNGHRPGERFWQGKLLRTAHDRYPDSTSLSFAGVIGVEPPLMALISAFVMDVDWVLGHLPGDYPVMLITRAGGAGTQSQSKTSQVMRLDTSLRSGDKTFAFAPRPRIEGYGVMHTKFFVLYYPDFCRICIPTANAINYDWNSIENAIYIQDFPRRVPVPEQALPVLQNPTHTTFSSDLYKYIEALGCHKRFMAPFEDFDFSASRDYQLVWSRQGWYETFEEFDKAGGISSLARAVQAFNPSPGGVWSIEATGSSIGDLAGETGSNWLKQMLAACAGRKPETYFSHKSKVPPNSAGPATKLPIKIVFPTLRSFDESFNGRPGGGTLFFPSKHWTNQQWPRELLYQGWSKRQGVIAHTKHIVAIHKPGPNPPAGFVHEGWIYTGSHNFTPSAWGKLSQQKGAPPKLCNNNYELGVLMKITGSSEKEIEDKASELATYRRPLLRYDRTDEPWRQDTYLS